MAFLSWTVVFLSSSTKIDSAKSHHIERSSHLSQGISFFKKIDIPLLHLLTHWGRVTHICVGKLTTIGSDNGLSPGRRLAIIWTIAGILLIGPLGTNFSEILIGIQTFSFKEIHLKMSSAKWRPSCFGLNVLKHTLWEALWTDILNGSMWSFVSKC